MLVLALVIPSIVTMLTYEQYHFTTYLPRKSCICKCYKSFSINPRSAKPRAKPPAIRVLPTPQDDTCFKPFSDKKFTKKMNRDSSFEEVIGNKSILRRHPLVASHLLKPVLNKISHIVGRDTDELKWGEEESEFGEMGQSIDLMGMYVAGRDFGNTDKNPEGKRVNVFRRFYRRHPIISGILLRKPLHGWVYHKGQQDARAEDVHRALYPYRQEAEKSTLFDVQDV